MKYEIKLGNKKRGDTEGEYIGRGSPLGNPYRIGRDGTREEVIVKFSQWIVQKINAGDPDIINELGRLEELTITNQGLTLLCYCAPEKCHGEIIRAILDGMLARRIEFQALIIGGKHDGQVGRLTCQEFKVGMRFELDGQLYEVEPGPAGTTIEKNQEGHDNLVVRCKLVEE